MAKVESPLEIDIRDAMELYQAEMPGKIKSVHMREFINYLIIYLNIKGWNT